MLKEKIVLNNTSGLHLRPAGLLCKEAMKFQCRITFGCKGTLANAKSVLSVLGAGVKFGDEIELICDGVDEEEAMAKLKGLFEKGLVEDN